MLLAIDVGNTNISIGIYDQERQHSSIPPLPAHHWRIRTARDKMPDEYAVLFRALLCEDGLALEDMDRSILSSVVPPLTGILSEMIAEHVKRDPLVVGPGVRTGIRIRTDNPAEVGADLVANAVGAYYRFQSNCIVVGFGTALTFTAVAEPGDLLGVAIAPGLNTAASALSSRTAQLPHVQLLPPPSVIGRNTVHSIRAGLVFGYLGLVEALIQRMRAEMGGQATAIATGGLARAIAPLSDEFAADPAVRIDPWLTLDGLRIIAERNS